MYPKHEDLFDLGKVVQLACNAVAAIHNLPRSLDHIARTYSPELQKLVLFLFSKPGPRKTIDEVVSALSNRVLDDFNSTLKSVSSLK